MDETLLDNIMEKGKFKAGDVPGEGTYRCLNCSVKWLLQNIEDLPECPECNGLDFAKEDDSIIF